MRNNRKTRPSPRGLLADQGSGKGDAPRHTLNAQWQANYDAIDWGRNAPKCPIDPCPFCKPSGFVHAVGYIQKILNEHYSPDSDTKPQ